MHHPVQERISHPRSHSRGTPPVSALPSASVAAVLSAALSPLFPAMMAGPARAADCAATISTALVTECELPAGLVTITSTGSVSTIDAFFSGAITNSLTDAAGLVNSGLIADTGISGFSNTGTVNAITNNSGATIRGQLIGLDNSTSAVITTLTNDGAITGVAGGGSIGLRNSGRIGTLDNSAGGTISGVRGIALGNTSTVTLISNSGVIQGLGNVGLSNAGSIGTLTNQVGGSILGLTTGFINAGGASVSSLTNLGSIAGRSSSGFDINNSGTITTLNNLQGAGNPEGTLRFNGRLPVNYNIVIDSPNRYGQLQVSNASGVTKFGVGADSVVIPGATYSAVLSGLSADRLSATTGALGSSFWTLVKRSGSVWDLVMGPSAADTQQALAATAATLHHAMALQGARLNNGLGYDCSSFGRDQLCVSVGVLGAQGLAADGQRGGGMLLTAAYRALPNLRVGVVAEHRSGVASPSAAVSLRQGTPMLGVFAVWNAQDGGDGYGASKGAGDGAGAELRVSAAQVRQGATVTRPVLGSSEPGAGNSVLESQGVQAVARLRFAVADGVLLSPYLGLRYQRTSVAGYTEAASDTVRGPLSYAALRLQGRSVLAGLGLRMALGPHTALSVSMGVEADRHAPNAALSGRSSRLSGLSDAQLNSAGRADSSTRRILGLGVQRDLGQGRALGLSLSSRQEARQAAATTTVAATYTVGF